MPSAFSRPPMRCSRPGEPGRGPRPGQGLRVAQVGPEHLGAVRRRRGWARWRSPGRWSGRSSSVGQPPRLGAVGQVAVGQQDHRRAVLDGDADRLDGGVEAVRRGLGGDDRHRRLAVAAVHGVEQVGLLGLGGQAGRRAAALDVDDQQRQLEADGQAHRLRLQVDARARRGRDAERAAEGGAEGGADARRSRPRPGRCARRTACAWTARGGCPRPA